MEANNLFLNMNSDLSKYIQNNDKYLKALNLRPITSLGQSSGGLVNTKGNKCEITFPTLRAVYKFKIFKKYVSGVFQPGLISLTINGQTTQSININENTSPKDIVSYLRLLNNCYNGTFANTKTFSTAYDNDYFYIYQMAEYRLCTANPSFEPNITVNNPTLNSGSKAAFIGNRTKGNHAVTTITAPNTTSVFPLNIEIPSTGNRGVNITREGVSASAGFMGLWSQTSTPGIFAPFWYAKSNSNTVPHLAFIAQNDAGADTGTQPSITFQAGEGYTNLNRPLFSFDNQYSSTVMRINVGSNVAIGWNVTRQDSVRLAVRGRSSSATSYAARFWDLAGTPLFSVANNGVTTITSTLYRNNLQTIGEFIGTGSPEGVITASPGSTFSNSDGTNPALYVKRTGTGNTNWGAAYLVGQPLILPAGTATASTAPLKFTSGTNLTTPEAGAVEYDGTEFYGTNSTGRGIFARVLKGSATLDFPDTASGSSSSLTITVTGAATTDSGVSIQRDNASIGGTFYEAVITGTNTVTVYFHNFSGSNQNPVSGTFRATVTK